MGILNAVSGIIIGKPQNNINYDEYKDIWKKMAREWKIYNTPIFYNASFGHNEPKCIIPLEHLPSLILIIKLFIYWKIHAFN